MGLMKLVQRETGLQFLRITIMTYFKNRRRPTADF